MIKVLRCFGTRGFGGACPAEKESHHSVSGFFNSSEFSSLYLWVEGTNFGPLGYVSWYIECRYVVMICLIWILVYRMLVYRSDLLDLCIYPYVIVCCGSGMLVRVIVDWLSSNGVP